MVAGIPGASGLTAWQLFIKDPEQQLTNFRKQPTVQKEIDYFKEKFSSFTSIEDLTKDYRAMKVLLSAFQLEDEINYTARNQQIIEEPYTGDGSEDSLVNKLNDPRFKELAQTLDYQTRGDAVFKSGVVLNEVIDRYVVNEFEKSLGDNNPGLREAAYFARTVGDFTNSYQLLGNKALRTVIETGLNLPSQFVQQDIDQQVRLLEKRVDVEDFFTEDAQKNVDSFALTNAQNDLDTLSPLYQTGNSAYVAVNNVVSQLSAIQDELARIDDATDPLGANAAEVAFQGNGLGELLQAGGLIQSGEDVAVSATQSVAELLDLYHQTVGLDPVADAAEIADNQARYQELVDGITAGIQNATFINPETGTEESLLLAVPGPGATSVTYQTTSTSTAVTVNGFDLTGFLADIQSAATDFSAGNYLNAQNTLLGTRQQLYDARNGLIDAADTYDDEISSVDEFVASIDSDAVSSAASAAFDSERNAQTVVSLLGQLQDLSTQLSDVGLTPTQRSDLNDQFTTAQTQLDALLNPPDPDNYLTNSGATVAVNATSTFTIRGIDFNDGATYADIDPARVPADAADAASLVSVYAGYKADAERLYQQLTTDRTQLDALNRNYDPYRDVLDDLQSLTDDLPDIQASAQGNFGGEEDEDGNVTGGRNLLNAGAADISVQLGSGTIYRIHGQGDFISLVQDVITSANSQIATNRAGADTDIQSALDAATAIRDQLKDDLLFVNGKQQELGQVVADNTPEEDISTSDFANPYADANKFTLQFIQRYISLYDLNNQTASDPITLLFDANNDTSANSILNLLV